MSVTPGLPPIGQKTSANSVPVVLASDQSAVPVTGSFGSSTVTVTGTVTVTQTAVTISNTVNVTQSAITVTGTVNVTQTAVTVSGTVAVSAVLLPLPAGAATSALQLTASSATNQVTINSSLTTINATLGSPFQAGGTIGAKKFIETNVTNGFVISPFNWISSELNSLVSGSAVTSSVGGTAGVFNQNNYSNSIYGSVYFTSGGSFTPTASGYLAGWFLLSPDGGSTFESLIATASTTTNAVSRAPDFIVPFDNAAYGTNSVRWCQGRYVQLPWESHKILIQNLSGVALPASGNTIKVGPTAVQY